MPPIEIIADDREQKSNVIRHLQDIDGVSFHIRRLKLGDYQAANRIVFERKTLKDFSISIIDGRFFKQMTRLANTSLKGVLILEGTGKDLAETNMQREAIQGALITASLILGIPLLRSKDPGETARLMVYAARQVLAVAAGGLHRPGYRPKSKPKRQLYILQGLPGIGPERARRLLKTFGGVEGVITASRSELQAVEGIGKNTADRIKWAVEEQLQPYGGRDPQS